MQEILERIAARLGLAIALAFTIAVGPTVAHALWVHGPVTAVSDLITLTGWIVRDLGPSY
jgi:hypothetical protein